MGWRLPEANRPERAIIPGMPPSQSLGDYKRKIAVAFLLTFSSGLVDIVGFLGIFNLFSAHVTGTTVHFGQGIVFRNRDEVVAASVIVCLFFLGSVCGRAIVEAGARRRFRRIASITLTIEAVLLVVVVAARIASGAAGAKPGPPGSYIYLALLASAMGVQTATLTRVGPLTVHTTFVTGMINKLAQLVSRILFRAYDFLRGRATAAKRAEQSAEAKQALVIFLVWVCYALGAIAGTGSYVIWGIRALFVAIAGLALSVVTDIYAPLSVAEEREQSER